MNIEEAKQWLSAYVPSEGEPAAPEVREALRVAGEDSELGRWLESRLELDEAVRAAVRQEPLPEGLEQELLETVKLHPARRSRRNVLLRWLTGLAALLIVGLGLTLYLLNNESIVQEIQAGISGQTPDSFPQFRDAMAFYIRNVYFQLDHSTDSLPSIENWLAEHEAPTFDSLPGQLTALPPIGCKEFDWRGNQVSLICFRTRNGKIVHLFILERGREDSSNILDVDRVARSAGLETGGWITSSRVYLLVGSHPEVDVEFALG